MSTIQTDTKKLEALIAEAKASGGSERANYQIFVISLCEALGLERPAMAKEENQYNDYVFERTITFKHLDGSVTSGFIDCYLRNSFVLEAKQSRKRQKLRLSENQLSLLPEDAKQFKSGHAKRGTRGWDQIMVAARKQAEDYARALPVEHGYPPFLLVVDVGNVIEVFADFSGQGKNYAHFPDRQSYRISMDDLREERIQSRLRAIWKDPLSLDPTRISAEVTRDIAERLAKIARHLEIKHDPKDVAEFLMRCLFTMFAEDVKLIPDKGFYNLLGKMRSTPENFVVALESLWSVMDSGGYAPHLNATLKKFNGSLFKKRVALPLDKDDINELWIAADKDWSAVEPAIFGTLLERALDPRERSKLGAHYTPRIYVERLVIPTIIEPLRTDWELIQGQVKELRDKGDNNGALAVVKSYHHKLCTIRVLDPACGTGNFLYVSLELMKRLEGEVLEALENLGENQASFIMEGETVSPRQFYGLEINPRAVPIAELVLWIGYLKWQLKTSGLSSLAEPILHAYGTIKQQDAVIAYDRQEALRDAQGRPLSRWDGVTKKLHPITGEEIPDPDANVPLFSYVKLRQASWPKADFIIGNPPFIGNKRMIHRLGEGYATAVRKANSKVADSVDFVMYWWWKAAQAIKTGETRRFGFVTTSKVTQSFNRTVVESFIKENPKCSVVFTIPDHPWNDDDTSAAVRVAFTVGEIGEKEGVQQRVIQENSDGSAKFLTSAGLISSKLGLTRTVSSYKKLTSNSGLSHQGVIPLGEGFRLTGSEAANLGYPDGEAGHLIKPYKIGRDLLRRDQGLYIIDLYGYEWNEVKKSSQRVAQIVLDRVKPERDHNRRPRRKERFWLYADSCEDMRQGLKNEKRYIATCRTAKHRAFVFLSGNVLPDTKIVAITIDRPDILAVLSSRLHVAFAIAQGGRQGVGNDPVYQHSDTFNPFPFPELSKELSSKLNDLGERLDEFRKHRLAAHSFLTMTEIYNNLERLRELDNGCDVVPLTESELDVHQAGLISILKEIHDDIDRTVLSAYGWEDLIPVLVGKPGATVPSPHKTEEQEQAEEELLDRLFALNQERAVEEKSGLVRWLRPEYQTTRLGVKAPRAESEHVGTLDIELPEAIDRLKWPTDGLEQIRLVRDLLAKAPAPTPPDALANVFDGRNTAKRRGRIAEVLETLVATGLARTGEYEGQRRYFLPR
ncbi:hypothetical protein M446_7058 (plasmid) [Methylobacterium sp. 4-46]|uniref:class I SAM-dependent DNA methyltransferase n=1 Tax=Methylobacterium sp. (strain 4-46) TaxID=426117 RepID=UPI000165CC7D|nr:DNA methyltransferase [Methylobacterium sp. 4-46]ACA21276.1 hypothetical protein M446_7058 [Methylobacterium sp. 4-46]